MAPEDLTALYRKCERLLLSCPGVVEARVYEVRRKVVADLVVEDEVNLAGLRRLCRARLGRRNVPELIFAQLIHRDKAAA